MKLALSFLLIALAVPAQNLTDLWVDKVATTYVFTAGPGWSRDGYLIFSDVPSDQLLQLKPGVPMTIFRAKSNGASGNTLDAQGRFYSCETHSRRVTRTDKKGNIEVLADRWQGKRLN